MQEMEETQIRHFAIIVTSGFASLVLSPRHPPNNAAAATTHTQKNSTQLTHVRCRVQIVLHAMFNFCYVAAGGLLVSSRVHVRVFVLFSLRWEPHSHRRTQPTTTYMGIVARRAAAIANDKQPV